MIRLLFSCLCLGCAIAFFSAPLKGDPNEISVAQAVSDFNQRAGQDSVGKSQPPLTEDEVVAALHFMTLHPSKETLGVPILQKIADTHIMPADTSLGFLTGYSDYNHSGLDIAVWRIDLTVVDSTQHDGMGKALASCVLRLKIISSKLHTSNSDKPAVPNHF